MSMSYRRQQSLQSDIHQKRQKLSLLTQSITNFKTQNSKQEFEIWKLEDQVADYKKVLEQERANIDHLRQFEQESLDSLGHKFELQRREISAEIDHGLAQLKDNLALEIQSSIAAARERAEKEQNELKEQIRAARAQIQAHKSDLNRTLIGLKEEHHLKVLKLQDEGMVAGERLQAQVEELESAVRVLKTKREALELETCQKNEILCSLQAKMDTLDAVEEQRQKRVTELQAELKKCREKSTLVRAQMESREREIEQLHGATSKMIDSFPPLEHQRRILHEELQNLKGNIRVFCRLRPSDGSEVAELAVSDTLSAKGKQQLTLKADASGISNRTFLHHFHFDKVFKNSTNSDIFLEISQLVQSCLDGHNVCVFAYGQTGSGKTHTMSHANDGMIPLSVKKIFSDIANLKSQGWQHSVQGRFIEIYNEQILDLLGTSGKYEIKHDDAQGKTTVTNCQSVVLKSAENCHEILERATSKRSTASTMANSRSSRSHFIFTLDIFGKHASGKTCCGSLNLVDLAGSERLASLQAKGDRLKETQAINRSLSCLGDVIMSLKNQKSHVPYRNSKLTYYLKHSLGGNSKTLMFVNVSPLAKDTNETLNSLRFAAKVNETKMGE